MGIITATLHDNGEASVTNVPSHRKIKSATVNVPGIGDNFPRYFQASAPLLANLAWL